MLEIRTLGELVDWTRNLHRQMARHLTQCAGKNEEERARALLEYVAGHERRMEKLVANIERHADAKAMKTHVYDYLSNKPIEVNRTCDIHCETLGFDEIAREVLDFHRQVIKLYRTLLGKADTQGIKNLLGSILEMEENRVRRLAGQIGRMADL